MDAVQNGAGISASEREVFVDSLTVMDEFILPFTGSGRIDQLTKKLLMLGSIMDVDPRINDRNFPFYGGVDNSAPMGVKIFTPMHRMISRKIVEEMMQAKLALPSNENLRNMRLRDYAYQPQKRQALIKERFRPAEPGELLRMLLHRGEGLPERIIALGLLWWDPVLKCWFLPGIVQRKLRLFLWQASWLRNYHFAAVEF